MDFGPERKRGALYEVLGCNERSSQEQIMAEYRVRAREMHPDKSGDDKEFLKIQEAKSILGDEERRRRYNEWIHSSLPLSFDLFEKNIGTVKQSTHWAALPSTPMIDFNEEQNESTIIIDNWHKNRYHSNTTGKFRNYQI
ncbi:hypothetical protein PRIPAC_80492 [Pristionchus pacificus]|nr:hypothetical protein PRIPAC_80492 [Pristionchus pacificus]